jgi:hypothetical protein
MCLHFYLASLVYFNVSLGNISLDCSLDDRWFESRQGLEISLFTTASTSALGHTQPPIQWVPVALSMGVNWPGREADHSPPSSADVKNAFIYTYTPPIRLIGVVLIESTGLTLYG